ncbi:lysozyme [Dyella marensis]|uniref:Lysozyme n=1 Tax=Dyella marensis TaxID=500610 RepID=A0A1I1ZYZ5_9GAMM|nr:MULTISPECIES: lysozyme [Dyella]SFE36881.1 lysozyme [Dyella marensis]
MSGSRGKLVAGALALLLSTAAAFVQPWEGKKNDPYTDIAGVPTVCIGHTGSDVQARHYSDAECDDLLKADLAKANSIVRRCITVAMTTGQETALTSAAFNIGPSVVCGSTLARLANSGDWAGACAQLDRWVYAGGRRVDGLVRRRAAERALCEGRA